MHWGKKRWAIAEGYIPAYGHGEGREFESHETICVLNPSDEEAEIRIIIYFSDREPVGPYRQRIEARRTSHIRFNDLRDPIEIPKGIDYSCTLESSVPVIVQHTRLDTRQAESALMTTIAYSE